MYAPQFNPPEQLKYGQDRYSNEVNRLFGVLNKRLGDRPFVAGDYSIADMAIWPWVVGFKNFAQNLEDFPALQKWFEEAGGNRPAVVKGKGGGAELGQAPALNPAPTLKRPFGPAPTARRSPFPGLT